MKINFQKYQGTGNDFIIIDNRESTFAKSNTKLIAQLCHRKFGIGADGLILLENCTKSDFKMVYYNADGNQSSMCGNGGRCIVSFAKNIGIIAFDTTFSAIDGMHYATIDNQNVVALQMKNVDNIKVNPDYVFLDTGSPHHIVYAKNLKDVDVKVEGAKIRYSDLYGEKGSNVNFVNQINSNTFAIRTYERGVEDETLSCGTGATAVAIAMKVTEKTISNQINILVEGGELQISFQPIHGQFKNVFLKGETKFVFDGTIDI